MEALVGQPQPEQKFSWENLRFLYAVLTSEDALMWTPANQRLLVDALREMGELLLWEDQQTRRYARQQESKRSSMISAAESSSVPGSISSTPRNLTPSLSAPVTTAHSSPAQYPTAASTNTSDTTSAANNTFPNSSSTTSSFTFFDFFMEKQLARYFLSVLQLLARNARVDPTATLLLANLLQVLNMLLENLGNSTSIFTLLSQNYINEIILWGNFLRFMDQPGNEGEVPLLCGSSKEDVVAYFVTLLKILSLKLNVSTLAFFFHQALPFVFHPSESMVRIAGRTLTLNVFRIHDSSLKKFLLDDSRSGTIRYFNRIVDLLIHWSCLLNETVVSLQTASVQDRPRLITRFQTTIDDILDHFLYLNDVFSTGMEELNAQVSEILMDRLVWSLYLDSLAHHMIQEATSVSQKDTSPLPERPLPSNVFQQTSEIARVSIRLHPLTCLYLVALIISIFNKAPFVASLCQDLFSREPTSTMQLRRIMTGTCSANKHGNILRKSIRSFLEPLETNDALALLSLLIMQLTVEHSGLDSSALSKLDMMPRKLARKHKLMETLVSGKEEAVNTTGIQIPKRGSGSANLMVSRRPSSFPSSLSPMASAKLDDLGPLGQADDRGTLGQAGDRGTLAQADGVDPLAQADERGALAQANDLDPLAQADERGALAQVDDLGPLTQADDLVHRLDEQLAVGEIDGVEVEARNGNQAESTGKPTLDATEVNDSDGTANDCALGEKSYRSDSEYAQQVRISGNANAKPRSEEQPSAVLRASANALLHSPPSSPSMRRPVAPTVALNQNFAAASTGNPSIPAYNEELVEVLLLFLERACVSFRSRLVTLQAALSFLVDLIYDPQQVKQTHDTLQTLLLPNHYAIWERFESAVLYRLSSALEDPRREADDQNTHIPWAPEDIVSLFRDPFHGETNHTIFDQMPNFQLDSRSLLIDGSLGGNVRVTAADLLFPDVPLSIRNWTNGRRCVDSLEHSMWADHVWYALFLVKSVKRVREMLG